MQNHGLANKAQDLHVGLTSVVAAQGIQTPMQVKAARRNAYVAAL